MKYEIYRAGYPNIVVFETKEAAQAACNVIPSVALGHQYIINIKKYIASCAFNLDMNITLTQSEDLIMVIEKTPYKKIDCHEIELWHVIIGEKFGWINVGSPTQKRLEKIT
jgi:hypothetical protein